MLTLTTKRNIEILNIKGENVEIDKLCVPMVKYFNKIGLDTKFCCEGHSDSENFEIMFEDYITDKQIVNFINKYSNKYDHTPFLGKFVKWARKLSNKMIFNWIYTVERKDFAERDYKVIINKNKLIKG